MPGFSQSLLGRDLGHLRIVAELWRVDLNAPDARTALQRLEAAILVPELVEEVTASLPADARQALQDLTQNKGRLPWALFTRRYGAVREVGASRRDREEPHLQPISPAEVLWYRAFISRSFFDTPTGPEEFAYIPDDLLALLPFAEETSPQPMGRPATPEERQHIIPASASVLDHACTLLSALRMGLPEKELAAFVSTWNCGPLSLLPLPLNPKTLRGLLFAAGLIDDSGIPQPEPTRRFLEAPRGEALQQLFSAWLRSPEYDELRLIPHLSAEGAWVNDPLRTRQAVLGFLSGVPRKSWWSLGGFIHAVHEEQPDFQRHAGDYDSWFLRDLRSGEYLRGFERWHEVDGLLLRALITGPLHWLGVFTLASRDPDSPVSAFRYSKWAADLLEGRAPQGLAKEDGAIQASSDGRVLVQRSAPRAARYQVARFCEWDKETPEAYRYRLTAVSLSRARQQGLTTGHLLALLRRSAGPVPPSLVKAIERWEKSGTEAHFERLLVLRLASPEILNALRGSRAARFLGDPLGPTAVIVRPGAMEKVLATLVELGYWGEAAPEPEPPLESDT